MTEPTNSLTTHHAALRALIDDVQTLTPRAARWACSYLPTGKLPDVWETALLLALHARAGAEPWPDLETLVDELGRPGCWTMTAYTDIDGMAVRLWLAGVETITARYALVPPAAS